MSMLLQLRAAINVCLRHHATLVDASVRDDVMTFQDISYVGAAPLLPWLTRGQSS